MLRKNAFLTVEAAVIVPFATVCVGALLYFVIYVYDRCLLEQDTMLMAMRGSQIVSEMFSENAIDFTKDMKLIADDVYKKVKTYRNPAYMAFSEDELKVTVKGKKVSVESSGYISFPLATLIIPDREWKIKASYSAYADTPVNFVRLCVKIKNLIK